ncbi:MAG: hypothetical protein AAGN82_23260, partial [Myxococcota bacterium]
MTPARVRAEETTVFTTAAWVRAAFVLAALVLATGCSPPARVGGCDKDIDCKGARICVARACTDATPTPAPAP